MEGPGMSIFQGSELKLDNSLQRREEEELLEEGKKREAELRELFQEAFDDFQDNDTSFDSTEYSGTNHSGESRSHLDGHHPQADNSYFEETSQNIRNLPQTSKKDVYNGATNTRGDFFSRQQSGSYRLPKIPEKDLPPTPPRKHITDGTQGSSSENSTHYSHCLKKSQPSNSAFNRTNHLEDYKNAEYRSVEELQVLYEARIGELAQLRRDHDEEREAHEEVVHQLRLLQQEKDHLISTNSHTDKLLALSKEKVSELETLVNSLKSDILKLEKEKDEKDNEVKISHLQVVSLQQRIAAMERHDLGTNREKQMDQFIESMNTKHQREINILEQKLSTLENRYKQKEEECARVEKKLEEVERKRAALVLEKCDSAARQETALETLLDQANQDKVFLTNRLAELEAQCGMLQCDLEQYESAKKLQLWGGSSSDEGAPLGPRPRPLSHRSPSHRQPSSQLADINAKLKDELHKSLLGQRTKRHEINKLQEQVRAKELQIQEMKEKERLYLTQVEGLKADMANIISQFSERSGKEISESGIVNDLKLEVEKLTSQNFCLKDERTKLRNEIEKLNQTLKQELASRVEQGEEYLQFHEKELNKVHEEMKRSWMTREKELSLKLEKAVKERDEIKGMFMDLRQVKNKLSSQLVHEKEKSLKLIEEYKTSLAQFSGKNMQGKNNQHFQEFNENSKTALLEEEVTRLRREVAELPLRHSEELEQLKTELGTAKGRLVDLEARLRAEWESKFAAVFAEREDFRRQLTEKVVMEKSKHPLPAMKDCSTMTDESPTPSDGETLPDSGIESLYKVRVEAQLREVKTKMEEERRAEVAATEERVKSITTQYYANQIEQLEERFKVQLTAIINKERETFRKVISEKDVLIEQLNCNKESAEALLELKRKIEEEQAKVAGAIKTWSTENEKLKTKSKEDDKKLQDLQKKLSAEKKSFEKCKIQLENCHKKVEDEKSNSIVKMKNLVNKIIKNMNIVEDESASKLLKVEQEFKLKQKELRESLKQRSA